MFEWRTASNAIYLGEDEGGKGRQFKARFLVPGLVKYDYGVCLLTKENADKFINGFTGCPVVINHQTVTDKNVKDVAVGDIFSVWFDEKDGYYWCNGILRDKEAIKLIDEGYSVSCQYLITEYSDNTSGKLHNGNPYDKIIENGKPEHLAIVNNPRYEGAIIAVNALLAENEDRWITIKPNGEENKGRHLLLKDGESPAEAVRRVYGDKNQKQLFDTKEYKKTKEDFKKEDEEKQKQIEEYKKSAQKRQDNLKYLGVENPDKLEDLSGDDITFEEWESKKEDDTQKAIEEDAAKKEKYVGLSEEEYSKIAKEYRDIIKTDNLTPQQVKRIKEMYPYFIKDAEYNSKDSNLNEPTREYYKKQIDKLKKEEKDLNNWFDLSKHEEKHMSQEWKKYLSDHPDEFTFDKDEGKEDTKKEKYKKGNGAKITEKRFENLFVGGALENNQYRITKVLSNKAQVTFDKKRGQISFYRLGDLSDSKDCSAPKGTVGMLKEFSTDDYDKLVDYLFDKGEGYRFELTKASNDLITTDELFVTDFKDALYTALAEGIVNRLGE